MTRTQFSCLNTMYFTIDARVLCKEGYITLHVSFYPDDTKAADFSSRGHNYIICNKFERSGTRELLPSKALTVW